MSKNCNINEQILWIGCYESDFEFNNKVKKGYNLASAQIAQKNLIMGIEENSKLIFDSINGSVLPPFPYYKDKKVDRYCWSHTAGAEDVSVGFKNIKYINRILCKHAMLKEAKKWISSKYRGGELKIFVYSMRSAPMATANYIKKRIPNAQIILIVTDLPKYMDLKQNWLKSLLKSIDWLTIKSLQKSVDNYIIYAEQMSKYLQIKDDKWILMEGCYSHDYLEEDNLNKDKEKVKSIFYSGTLSMQYGIGLLIDTFMTIEDKNIELWLAGSGNAVDYIKKCSLIDKRIKYYGLIPREKSIALERKCYLLINMRVPDNEVSKFSFPSKLFEYLTSGNPVLSFPLEGIPKEYYDYMLIIKNKEDLKDTIIKAFSMDIGERIYLTERAKKFIYNEKNYVKQCKRICDFIWKR